MKRAAMMVGNRLVIRFICFLCVLMLLFHTASGPPVYAHGTLKHGQIMNAGIEKFEQEHASDTEFERLYNTEKDEVANVTNGAASEPKDKGYPHTWAVLDRLRNPFKTPQSGFEYYYGEATKAYRAEKILTAYYTVGQAIHFSQDSSAPSHVYYWHDPLNNSQGPRSYETFELPVKVPTAIGLREVEPEQARDETLALNPNPLTTYNDLWSLWLRSIAGDSEASRT